MNGVVKAPMETRCQTLILEKENHEEQYLLLATPLQEGLLHCIWFSKKCRLISLDILARPVQNSTMKSDQPRKVG
jgi:hypothetical protein